MPQAVHSTSFRPVVVVVVARSDSDMIHNTAVINLTYLGLALDGIVPGIAWWLTRAFSSCRCAVGGQKQLEKSANHFINAHCSRAKRRRSRTAAATTPAAALRCDVSDLQHCCARLHLGGCTSFGLMDPAPTTTPALPPLQQPTPAQQQ